MSTTLTDAQTPVVDIQNLTRRFGAKRAIADVTITVPRGTVFGLIGANGAGKTTLIKHVLGLLKPTQGSVRVFGFDPTSDPVPVLARVGYLSEEMDLPGWMRVDELMRYTSAFYPDWKPSFAEELRSMFELDPKARIKNLSRGQRARAGLLVALAHRPDLLILDEPSSGLDPLVRQDILTAIIRTIADEGRTVLFSSHLLDEVEKVADRVAMIHEGSMLLDGELDAIKGSHHRLTLRFPQPQVNVPALPGALSWRGEGQEWTAVCNGQMAMLEQAAADCGAQIVERGAPSFEEIFVAQVRGQRLASEPRPLSRVSS
jgi:ABC-2 type transport system ATP-binding protein